MSIIEVDGLAKTFKTRERGAGLANSLRSFVAPRYREREAVKHISFALDAGEALAFIGPNGAGKSSTIKMLTGILYPSAGMARVLGYVPWQQRRQLAFQIASVFGQKSQLWYHLPPQDTFNLLARIYELDMNEYRKRRDFLIGVFDIADYLQTPARKLSLGERMRCELAAALLHKPAVIFLDEPTIGLDVIAKQRIRDLIGQLNAEEGVTVFLTSHDAGDIEQVCRRAIVINHGEIILDAPVARMKRDYLKVKTVDLLLEDAADELIKIDEVTGHQRLSVQLPGLIHEELLDTRGISILKAKGHGLKLEIDTSLSPLEPVIAAIMDRCHILDMNIADPPMEEIIARIYNDAPDGSRGGGSAPPAGVAIYDAGGATNGAGEAEPSPLLPSGEETNGAGEAEPTWEAGEAEPSPLLPPLLDANDVGRATNGAGEAEPTWEAGEAEPSPLLKPASRDTGE